MLEFLCVDLHNQCDNVINQCYFIFCIVVYNGAEYILLLDFLWTHPNSLDWPIESSGPNNEWYISAKTLFLASSWLKRACTLKSTWTESWGGNGRAHWTRIFILSQTEHILGHQWSKKFAFHGINQGKCFIYCHLMHALISTCDPMSFKISSLFTCWSTRIPSKSLSMLSSIVSRKEDKCTWKVNSVNHSRILQLKRKNSNRISQAPFCYT